MMRNIVHVLIACFLKGAISCWANPSEGLTPTKWPWTAKHPIGSGMSGPLQQINRQDPLLANGQLMITPHLFRYLFFFFFFLRNLRARLHCRLIACVGYNSCLIIKTVTRGARRTHHAPPSAFIGTTIFFFIM